MHGIGERRADDRDRRRRLARRDRGADGGGKGDVWFEPNDLLRKPGNRSREPSAKRYAMSKSRPSA
jgi:hypothetical protein